MNGNAILRPEEDVLLTTPQLQKRWGGCSAMMIWRRHRDSPEMPAPIRMGNRRLYRLSEILAYEELLVSRPQPKTPPQLNIRNRDAKGRAVSEDAVKDAAT